MAKTSVLQVRMDSDLKEHAESLYKNMGTSLAEAVRIFARQSVLENGMPFTVHMPAGHSGRTLGIADGRYAVPDDIDADNEEIAALFGVV